MSVYRTIGPLVYTCWIEHENNFIMFSSDVYFSEEELLQLALEVLQGLAYLNRNGVTHRNLKSENVLFDTEVRLYEQPH